MKTTIHYNCLGCPQCSNPLYDPLYVHEFKSDIKTVKCINCDFTGYRQGWQLLSTLEKKAHENKKVIQEKSEREFCGTITDAKETIPSSKNSYSFA